MSDLSSSPLPNSHRNWKELEFHLYQLRSGDPGRQLEALAAINRGIGARPECSKEEALAAIFKLFEDPSTLPEVRSECVQTIMNLGAESEKHLQWALSLLRDPETKTDLLMAAISGVKWSSRLKASDFFIPLKALLNHPNEDVREHVINSFHHMSLDKEVEGWKELILGDPDIKPLIADMEMKLAGAFVDRFFGLGLPLEGNPFDIDTLNIKRLSSGNPELTKEQLMALVRRVERSPTPVEYMGERFTNGARAIFLGIQDSYHDTLEVLASEILELRERYGLTNVALPFPPSASDRMEDFLTGKISYQEFGFCVEEGGYDFIIDDDPDEDDLDDATRKCENLRGFLQAITGKVELIYYEQPEEHLRKKEFLGDLGLDYQASILERVNEDRPFSRMLVLGGAGSTCNFVRDGSYSYPFNKSLAAELIDKIGRDKVVCLLEETWGSLRSKYTFGVNNLFALMELIDPAIYFACSTRSVSLKKLIWHEHTTATYYQNWDGIIFKP